MNTLIEMATVDGARPASASNDAVAAWTKGASWYFTQGLLRGRLGASGLDARHGHAHPAAALASARRLQPSEAAGPQRRTHDSVRDGVRT